MGENSSSPTVQMNGSIFKVEIKLCKHTSTCHSEHALLLRAPHPGQKRAPAESLLDSESEKLPWLLGQGLGRQVQDKEIDQLHPAHILGNFIVEVFSAGHLPVITFPRFPRGQISGNFQKFSVIQLCAFSNEVCISAQARDRAGEGEASSILGTPSQP